MIPPPSFTNALRRLDDQLRVRWARHSSCWLIERKLPPRHHQLLKERPNPHKSPRGLDRYDGWREGYVDVLFVHPSMLDNRALAAVAEADAWRRGGMAKVAQALDEADQQEEARQERELDHWGEAHAKEAHDRLAWLEGRRVVVGEVPTLTEEPSGASQNAE